MLKRDLIILLCLLVIGAFCFAKGQEENVIKETTGSEAASVEQGRVPLLTIADSKGDWGFPTPYMHYPRGPGYIRMSLVFDTLLWKNRKGELVPALAESWEYIEKDNAYIFNIRKGVKWHDGSNFTADDVIFTIDYFRKHSYKWVSVDMIDRVEKSGNSSVKMYLNKPYAPFIFEIGGVLVIIPKHIYKSVAAPENFQEAKAVIGTGPFMLVEYDRKQGTYLYKAFKDYYLGKPSVEKLSFVKIQQDMAPGALLKGEVDATKIPPDIAEKFKGAGLNVVSTDSCHPTKLMFNHTREPFNSKTFRQALAFGIDRNEIVKIAQRGFARKAGTAYFQDELWKNCAAEQYNYDPARAKSMLEELGYRKDGMYYTKEGKMLKLDILSSNRFERDGELIIKQMEKIGVKAILKIMESNMIDAFAMKQEFDMILTNHGAMGDPKGFADKVIGESHSSDKFFENQELIDLLKEQNNTMDVVKRKSLLDKAQKIFAEEIPSYYLYSPTWFWSFNDKQQFWYTPGGIATGIPIAINKLCFIH